MSNQTFLITLQQNNDLSAAAVDELRNDLEISPLHQKNYIELAKLAGNSSSYAVNRQDFHPTSLTGKKILFLGSSVTLGYGALGESFVDYLWKKAGVLAVKNAENGTTLVNQDRYRAGDSYIARFQSEVTVPNYDGVVLQLSTNDSFLYPNQLGKIIDDDHFDLTTITGSLEYLVSESKALWQCPILIYSNPYFPSQVYEEMVLNAKEIAKKYQIDLLDLFHDEGLKANDELYQADPIHPTRAGYLEKWYPKFFAKLAQMLK